MRLCALYCIELQDSPKRARPPAETLPNFGASLLFRHIQNGFDTTAPGGTKIPATLPKRRIKLGQVVCTKNILTASRRTRKSVITWARVWHSRTKSCSGAPLLARRQHSDCCDRSLISPECLLRRLPSPIWPQRAADTPPAIPAYNGPFARINNALVYLKVCRHQPPVSHLRVVSFCKML
jgi:hypothetical protein